MKKDKNNKRKVAIGAMLAAGMTTGAIATTACGQVKNTSQQSQKSEVELTAADKVVVEGQEVTIEDVAVPNPERQVAKPMYGVRQDRMRLLYGPRPNPNIRPAIPDIDESPTAVVETGVKEVMAAMLNVNSSNVKTTSKFNEDFNLTSEQRALLKDEIENKFDIVIPTEMFNKLKTVGDLVNCICVLKY